MTKEYNPGAAKLSDFAPAKVTEEAYYDTRASEQSIDHNTAIASRTLKLVEAVVSHTRDATSIHY